jgi:N-methylhydantoinase A
VTWRVAVDIGGTFTDLVAWDQDGDALVRSKVLTVPGDPVAGVVHAIDRAGIDLSHAVEFVHGSTIAINAVLQGTGARTALITTRGFRDVLEMGRKSRPDMYNLFFRPRICPVPRRLRSEVAERLDHTGEELVPLEPVELEAAVDALPDDVDSVAICLLHSYANPEHERRVADEVRRRRPELYVSASTDLSREAKEYERTCTAVVNAYVGPLVSGYIARLRDHLATRDCAAPLLITQSNGGVMTADVAEREPVRTMESGPAAGVTGVAWVGNPLDSGDLIAFDMGGTSAKACVISHGLPEVAAEYYIGGRVSGLPVQVPFLEIVEVGAGGGSIAHVDAGGGLRIGPRSAGSVPGPAAYGLGGTEPTITDANVVAGRINPDYFLGGEMRLSEDLARAALGRVAEPLGIDVEQCANAIIRIANTIMAEAIRAVTVERGRDPRDFTLVAYGGAGPLHATSLASELQIPRVLIPAGPGTFAAYGMLVTDLRHDVARTLTGRIDTIDPEAAATLFGELEREAAGYLRSRLEGGRRSHVRFVRRVDLRYVGQFHPLTMTVPSDASGDFAAVTASRFHQAHAERYGHSAPDELIEIGALRVTAISEVRKPPAERPRAAAVDDGTAGTRRVLYDDGEWRTAGVHRRDQLSLGDAISGPAVVDDPASSVVIVEGDVATVVDGGHLLITVGAAA